MVFCPTSEWFLFPDLRRKPLQQSAWIPLRAIENFKKAKTYGEVGYLRDTFACGSLAIPIAFRDLGETLGWSEIGVGCETRSYSDESDYSPADNYWLEWSDRQKSGVHLVLKQSFGWEDSLWHLNQDVILALDLKQEGDVWVRPDEGYLDVVRLHRDDGGLPMRMDMRTEHLRDYLAARQMALRIAWYRDRDAVLSSADHIEWRENPPNEDKPNYRFETNFHELHEGSGGMPFGGQSAIFTASRKDVFPDDDVPEFGPETNENVESSSRTFSHKGDRIYRVEGEIWCEEWIEPAARSLRVRGDKAPSNTSFIVDASGLTQSADELDNEDIGKYLWFRPDVIPDLLQRRGASWRWHTRYTGSVELSRGYHVHFGINRLNLINAYAYDIGKLPEWQRRIWQGFNIAPEGGVSEELLDAQMRVQPAATLAPERHLLDALNDVDAEFCSRFGVQLFRAHETRSKLAASIHRFRALDQNGVFALAKDISRLIVEAIDTPQMQRITPPDKNLQGTGSLKSLERVLATVVPTQQARDALSHLVGIYELRGADAHLPSSGLDDAFNLAGIDNTVEPMEQGLQMLLRTMQLLIGLMEILRTTDNANKKA